MKITTRSLTRAALIAAIYLLFTFMFQAVSFRAVQFRVSEALMLLPIFAADAVPGLFVGCLLGNLLAGGIWYDVVFGSIATLLAALCVRRLRRRAPLAAAMPAVFNGLIVGPIVYYAYMLTPGGPVNYLLILSSMATVALGEIAVCYALGLPLVKVLRRLPEETWHD